MESNNLFIVHCPRDAAESSRPVKAAIESLGTTVQMMPCVWLVKSDQRGSEIFNELRRVLAHGDQLLVIDATNDDFVCWPERGHLPDATS